MPFQHLTTIAQESATAAANTAVVVTIDTPATGARHYLYSLTWSYSGTPTGGRIYTAGGLAGDEFDQDITQAGVDGAVFPPCPMEPNAGLTVTLAAGGAGVIGKVTVCYGTFPI